MNDRNKQLLDEVIEKRLEQTLKSDANPEDNVAFKQAMEAIDRQIKISELEANRQLEISKFEAACAEQNLKHETAKSDINWSRAFKVVEFVVAPVAMAAIQHKHNMDFAHVLCMFEKDYTFTTTAGRQTSKFFNFKTKG